MHVPVIGYRQTLALAKRSSTSGLKEEWYGELGCPLTSYNQCTPSGTVIAGFWLVSSWGKIIGRWLVRWILVSTTATSLKVTTNTHNLPPLSQRFYILFPSLDLFFDELGGSPCLFLHPLSLIIVPFPGHGCWTCPFTIITEQGIQEMIQEAGRWQTYGYPISLRSLGSSSWGSSSVCLPGMVSTFPVCWPLRAAGSPVWKCAPKAGAVTDSRGLALFSVLREHGSTGVFS